MKGSNLLFKALDLKEDHVAKEFSRTTGIPFSRLQHYNKRNVLPTGEDLNRICSEVNIEPIHLMLKMGLINEKIKDAIQSQADKVFEVIKEELCNQVTDHSEFQLAYETKLGKLYKGDCLTLMRSLKSESIDLIFADPPFNLSKVYPSKIDDNLKESQYLNWCEEWSEECARLLKHGGSLLIWNLPKWNIQLADFLNNFLTFRHWISVDIKYSLPIAGRLYPSHYSLLYYCKGEKPKTFKPDRLPMPICPHCLSDLKDYGGYKDKMNPRGVNMSDVWLDIPPVRHAKYKKRNGANELSIKLLDRIIEMSSEVGDMVFDPFGGSGTTYAVAEIKDRRWLGIELGPVEDIIARFKQLKEDNDYLEQIRKNYNCLFTEESLRMREKKGLWTPKSVIKQESKQISLFR